LVISYGIQTAWIYPVGFISKIDMPAPRLESSNVMEAEFTPYGYVPPDCIVRFVPQQDRRQTADRRRMARGGRRCTDAASSVEPVMPRVAVDWSVPRPTLVRRRAQ